MTRESPSQAKTFVVGLEHVGQRLDRFLASQLPQFSRTLLRRTINATGVRVDGRRTKAAHRLRKGETVTMVLPELPRDGPIPENISLDVLYEDADLIAINKPSGMVVHPAKGNWQGTLASALAYHFGQLSAIAGPTRPGIVHRLDRETSGVIVVAKNDAAHLALARQFEQRTVEKRYWALTASVPDRDRDVIDQPIGVHPYQREKMAIREGHSTSRSASTFYEVRERFGRFALLNVYPKTGRTHQIRVHLNHIGCPILCDRLYGGHSQLEQAALTGNQENQSIILDRLALHAQQLRLNHPATDEPVEFVAPLADDLSIVVKAFRNG